MTISEEKQRFVIIIDRNTFDDFKELAQLEQRSASNLASKLITDYVNEHKK